ncbi:MAG: hypothetical protein NUV59_01275 [Patescibacteria group bacterium]|nr:hypothetical protein [Patescibacteria group bacterium]
MKFANGRDGDQGALELGIKFFLPSDRGSLVEHLLNSIPEEERAELTRWMRLEGNGDVEKYYLILLALAEAASKRGKLSRDSMLDVAGEIRRRKTARGILLPQQD